MTLERARHPREGDWVKREGWVWWHHVRFGDQKAVKAVCGLRSRIVSTKGDLEARPQLADGRTTLPVRFRCPTCIKLLPQRPIGWVQ